MKRRLMTREEVADLLRVSKRSVDRLRCGGRLRGLKIGTRRLFTAEEVDELLESSRRERPVGTPSNNGAHTQPDRSQR